jgi:hypothetical protein
MTTNFLKRDWKKAACLFFITIVLCCFSQAAEDTPIYSDTATFVQVNNSDSNYGDLTELQVRGPGSQERQGLVRWDLSAIPTGAVITDASIRFTLSTSGITTATPGILRLFEVDASWNEGDGATGVTWNSRPALGASEIAVAPFDQSTDVPGSTVYVFSGIDVIHLVQDWVRGTGDNNGVAVLSTVSGGIVKLYSDDEPPEVLRPLLTVSWQSPVGLWLIR